MSKRGLIFLAIFLTIHSIFPQVLAGRAANFNSGGKRSVDLNTKTNELQTTSNSDEGHDNNSSIIMNIVSMPLVLLWRLLILEPMAMIRNIIIAVQRTLMNVTGKIVSDVSEAALVKTWWITKNFMLPTLDEFSVKLARQEVLPESLNTAIMSTHSLYIMLKILGYLQPS